MKAIVILLLCVQVLCGATVQFQWTANTEPDLAGYKLYHGPASRTYTNAVVLGLTTTHALAVDGLQYFALTAFNTGGLESGFTGELIYDPPSTETLSLIVEQSTNGTIWEPVLTNEIAVRLPAELFRLRLERKSPVER